MNKHDNTKKTIKPLSFRQTIGAKAARKLKAQQQPAQGIWFGLGMMGLIGWSVTLPTLLGAVVGIWLDRRDPGRYSWTLMLLIVGLGLGCVNAWHWVSRQDREMRKGNGDEK
ncbi:MAG: F0F1 ATP synthase subunit [Elusimicrobia bacterium RIFOXYB2_FULL_49_7]|nr:MAG: F0F1 ATP synthase subunit [Elusimicrobia bacterium RIFOXYB2_FULL_49_7]